MGSRLVDGPAIYHSDKLKKVPKEYRAEFANLIPLAEANGAFECNPELVWSIVYAYNRNDITPDIVSDILDAFEKADMLVRYEANGKKYGYWVGIDKPGRLPAPSVLKKYNLASLPPLPTAVKTPEEQPKFTSSSNVPLDSYIVNECENVFGFAEDKRTYNKDLKAAVKQYGHDEVKAAFETWISSTNSFSGKRPISAFIKSLSGLTAVRAEVSSPSLQEVETYIAQITDNKVFFFTTQKPILASLITKYGKEDVIDAFEEFWNSTDKENQFAAKNFVEQATIRIEATKKKKLEKAYTESRVRASILAAQAESENTEEEEIEDEL